MSTRILLLGGRAPTALEWARHLQKQGCTVHAAESMKTYICQASNTIHKFHTIAPPAQAEKEFIGNLIQIIRREKIQRLIPTCEEAFYVAKHKETLSKYTEVFTSTHAIMQRLHNKYLFVEEMNRVGIPAPKSRIIHHHCSLDSSPTPLILKPVYSRFASKVFLHRPGQSLPKYFLPSKSTPWIAQEFIEGRNLCTFSIVEDGAIQFHVTYEPKYQLNRGAGMYLQKIERPQLDKTIGTYLKQIRYNGQIGFDFIERDSICHAIESNPRCTSGMHFIDGGNKKMVGLPIMIHALPLMFQGTSPATLFADFIRAKEVIWNRSDWYPFFYQIACLLALIKGAIKKRMPLLETTTFDIEYNGEA